MVQERLHRGPGVAGPLEKLQTRRWVVDVLEGTGRALGKRHNKYGIEPHGEIVLRVVPILYDRVLYYEVVDLSDPTRALTPTLDGPVLAVLAASGRPLTVGQIAAQAARGSEIGIRRSVARLVEQGIVSAVQMGRNQVHELNREHIAAPGAELLGGLRLELWRRLREVLDAWDPKAAYGCVFGSAARGDGGPDSDIDMLLVHHRLPREWPPASRKKGVAGFVDSVANSWAASPLSAQQAEAWQSQIDDLHKKVLRWTGNPLQVVDIPTWQWLDRERVEPEFFAAIKRDGITIAGTPFLLPTHQAR